MGPPEAEHKIFLQENLAHDETELKSDCMAHSGEYFNIKFLRDNVFGVRLRGCWGRLSSVAQSGPGCLSGAEAAMRRRVLLFSQLQAGE